MRPRPVLCPPVLEILEDRLPPGESFGLWLTLQHFLELPSNAPPLGIHG
jgi:hypothetical protein